MNRFAWILAAGALALATPAVAHERRGGSYAYSYPSYRILSARPSGGTSGRYAYNTYDRNYGYYNGYNYGRVYRPAVIYRQGPPYGRAWGYRRHHQVPAWSGWRNGWYGGRNTWYGGRNGWYGGRNNDWSRSCDRRGSWSGNGHHDDDDHHDHDGHR